MPLGVISYRLLAAAVVLPAVIVCADQLALEAAYSARWRGDATVPIFVVFVLQTLLLSQCVGRWLPDWRWRLGVLAWALALMNLLLYRAAVDGHLIARWGSWQPAQLLISAFLAGQLSAVVVWLILASVALETKSLLAAVASAPPFVTALVLMHNYVSYNRVGFLVAVIFVQLVATTGLSALLYALGWRIVYLETSTNAAQGVWLQFSIRHVLIATTAVAVFTGLGKAMIINPARSSHWVELLQITINGSLLGALALVAVWAALGSGRSLVRSSLLVLLAIALAALLWGAEVAAQAVYRSAAQAGSGAGWRYQQSQFGSWWIAWMFLAGTFLASWLSVLRVTGYRLVRQRNR